MTRVYPVGPSRVNPGQVHTPGTGHTTGPRPTHPKTLDPIGALAALRGGRTQSAHEGDTRPRADLPRSSRDSGGSRSWLSSMKHAANKTGHAISNGFNRAGHTLHRFGQSLNQPNGEPEWMRHMSEEDRSHYDYYGEVPSESSRSSHSSSSSHSSHSSYVAAPWERQESFERVEVRHRPMTPHEQTREDRRADYAHEVPRTSVEEFVRVPSWSSSSPSSSPGRVKVRDMTSAEQAEENAAARYHGHEPRTTVEEIVPSRPASPARQARQNRDALLANIQEHIPRMVLSRLDHSEPRTFVEFADILTKGTPYEPMMSQIKRSNPNLGKDMQRNWQALREHLAGLRGQGAENVPSPEWLFQNRPSRMMAFLVEGRNGGKLVRPTTVR